MKHMNALPLTNKYFSKKSIAVIFLALTVSIGMFAPLQTLADHGGLHVELGAGDDLRGNLQNLSTGGNLCALTNLFSFECVAQIISFALDIMLVVIGWLLILAALIFDLMRAFTLATDTYAGVEVIKNAWTAVRNVSNIFFIFILLIIAIATILRRESYGAKQLLVRLILVALFINFSYTITLYIILPANSLADFFVTTILNDDSLNMTQYKDSKEIVHAFLDGIRPGLLFDKLGDPDDPLAKEIEGYNGIQEQLKAVPVSDTLQKLLYTITGTFLGIILILFTAFVLLAGGFLFILRVAILWILMVLSPLAFLLMILPKTKEWGTRWWSLLINQAIFPAIFLFFFNIAVTIAINNNVRKIFHVDNLDGGNLINFIAFYVIILTFLYLSIWAARELGAYGASTAMGWASSLKKTATNAVGAIGAGTAYYTAGAAARRLQSGLGEEGMARMQLSAVTRPLARALDKTAGMGKRKETEEATSKAMMSLAPREFMARFSKMSNGEQDTILKNEGAMKRLAKARETTTDDREKDTIDATMRRQSYQTQAKFLRESPKAFGEAFSKGGLRPEIMTDAIEQSNKETLQKMISNTSADKKGELVTAVAQISPRLAKDMVSVAPQFWKEAGLDITQAVRNIDLEKVKQESLDELEKMDNAFFRHASVSQRQKVMSEGGDNVLKPYLKQMDNLGSTSADLAEKLDLLGDKASAIQFRNSPMFNDIHGLKIEKTVTVKEQPTTKDRARFDDMA